MATVEKASSLAAAPQWPNKWAIVVGVNAYRSVAPSLDFGKNDALEVASHLRQYLQFTNILEIHDDAAVKPERTTIVSKIDEFVSENPIGETDLLLFFFSGHGVIDPKENKDYLLPTDANLRILKDTGLCVESIAEKLKSSGCNNVVMFIDACREMAGGSRGVISIGEDSKLAAERRGILSFFSCDPKDRSWEIAELSHGSFTYSVLEAMKEGCCTTALELDKHLSTQVPLLNKKHSKPVQQPYSVIEPSSKGQLPIFHSSARRQKVEQEYDNLIQVLFLYWEQQQLETRIYNHAHEVILLAKKGEVNEVRIRLINELAKGAMTLEVFSSTWTMMQKYRSLERLGPLDPSKDLGPIQ